MPGLRVDAHHHLWDLDVRDQEWITGEAMAPIRRSFGISDLAEVTAATGVDRTVVVQTVLDAAETPELLAVAGGSDLVAAVTGWVDLTADSVADDLAALQDGPGGDQLRGIRHQVQGEPDPEWLCRPDVRRGLGAVARAGLVYELLTLPHQLPAAARTAAALPEAAFVLDHCSKPPIAGGELEPWATHLRELAGHPNVTCKLSGLVTEADWSQWTVETLRPYVEVVLEAFGPDRLMFGSDWPVCLLASSYQDWAGAAAELVAGLSPDETEAVFGGTARATFRIS